MKNFALTVACIFAGVLIARAQLSGSAHIVTNHNIIIAQGQQCTSLTDSVIGGFATSAYMAHPIPYQPPVPYNLGSVTLGNTSDKWSDSIQLPFKFCFFGQIYHRIRIGLDGEISFAPGFLDIENWSIPGQVPLPTTEPDQRNVIMAPWQSLDESYRGSVKYDTGGTYPNRYFVVTWNDVPLLGDSASLVNTYCSQNHHETQMVVLYETSNIIDIYIAQKDTLCSDLSGGSNWNNDLAVEGITNGTATASCTVPGRNATKWTATNDAWRFSPAGPPDYLQNWYLGSTLVGSGDSIFVCPTVSGVYTVQTTLTLCNNSVVTLTDSVVVTPSFSINNPVIIYPGCAQSGSISVQVSGGIGPLSYFWSNGQTGATDTALAAGVYALTITDSLGTSATASFNLQNPLTQALCMVTADSAQTSNIIIWEKANKPATDSFFIYRTLTPDTSYSQIAAIQRDSLSEYEDTGANPQLYSYRYRISLKDTCGSYNALSNYIQTIHLQYTGSGTFVWTPYVVENETSPVVAYNLLRDTSNNGSYHVIGSTADTTLSVADYSLYPTAKYEVQAQLNTLCTPGRSIAIITSNKVGDVFASVARLAYSKITLGPNPTTDEVMLSMDKPVAGSSVEVYNLLGERVYQSVLTGTNTKINLSGKSTGLYWCRVLNSQKEVIFAVALVLQ